MDQLVSLELQTTPAINTRILVNNDALHSWNVLLWNDDIHSMDYVVAVLVQTLSLDVATAADIMFEAHYNGKAVAWTGAKEPAELYRERLEEFGLTATVSR